MPEPTVTSVETIVRVYYSDGTVAAMAVPPTELVMVGQATEKQVVLARIMEQSRGIVMQFRDLGVLGLHEAARNSKVPPETHQGPRRKGSSAKETAVRTEEEVLQKISRMVQSDIASGSGNDRFVSATNGRDSVIVTTRDEGGIEHRFKVTVDEIAQGEQKAPEAAEASESKSEGGSCPTGNCGKRETVTTP